MRLVTDRLVLRHWRESDLGPFAAMNADPVVMEHFPSVLTREQSDALVARQQDALESGGLGLLAVEHRASGEFLGFVGLAVPGFVTPFTPCVEIGWRLARSAWGHGYATEGAAAALEHGFTEIGLEEIVSLTSLLNIRSQAVMERIGMTRDPADDFEHPLIAIGDPLRPHLLYRIRR